MSALLIRRRRPIGEPASATPTLSAGGSTLEGAAGAGRIVQALAELGIPLAGVVQLVIDAGSRPEDIATVEIGRTFDVVILGSHLVNLPDGAARRAFLGLAARHLAPAGTMLVEHHPLDWAETAAAVSATPGGSQLGMVDVRRDPPFVSAVSVYDVGGRVVRQPFTARVLSEAELASTLEDAGLAVRRRFGPTWLIAVSAN